MSTSSVPDPRVVDVEPAAVRLRKPDGGSAGDVPPRASVYTGEVGAFRQGDPQSRWALARYLVARTVGDGAVRALLGVAVLFAALTVVLAFLAVPTALTVLVGVVTVGWFVAWRLARALWTRLSGGAVLEPVHAELASLVAETRPDVRRELRRLDLPAHPFAAFVFARRLVGRRRAETTARMKQFDVDRVVPADRVDRLYLLLERTGPATAPRRG